MAHPATEKRGGNPDVKHKSEQQKPKDAIERKLEQGLEESMTGSDPVSVTQPPKIEHRENKIMQSKSLEANPLSPMATGVSDEARKAMKAAIDAMSSWRNEVNSNQKNLERVIDKITAAAEALGWPEEIAETARGQMQALAKMQTQTMDHMIGAWEEQMNSPSAPSAILAKLRSVPTLPVGSWPGAALSHMTNPFAAYMQLTQQWQKVWADAVAPWMKGGNTK